jgi:outer membrane biosynthesis protein TonB
MMDLQFETQKNLKASFYTATIICILLLFFILWKWPLQTWNPPLQEEGMEVNLGNSDMGLGDDQPFLPGEPAPAEQPSPAANTVSESEAAKEIVTDDKDPEAAEIKPPAKPKKEAKKIEVKKVPKVERTAKKQQEIPEAPPAPKPKAVFKGVNGSGTGGNDADSYKKGGNQGIAGGNGDQGRPGGDPDANNYTGGGRGNSSISVRGLQGRKISRYPSFSDDFNTNAKVAVDIRVDESGVVLEAVYNPRGSSGTADASMKALALRKAKEVKFNPGDIASSGTLIFNFTVK